MKSEPHVYSIASLKKDRKTLWTGVRNYQARNFMMNDMSPGDDVLFYHSNAEPPGIAGVARIVRANVADPSAQDKKSEYFDATASPDHPIWFCAEVEFVEELPALLPLNELRENKALAKMPLVQKGSRLSVQPVSAAEFAAVMKMSLETVATAAKAKGTLVAQKTGTKIAAPKKKK